MPEKRETRQLSFRLSAGAIRRMEALAAQLEIDNPDVVDLALKHLQGTLQRELGVWVSDPPPTPPKHTRRDPDAA